MPIHDWSRVDAGIFHDFHLAWVAELSRALNTGILPEDNYALCEQVARNDESDVLTLHTSANDRNGNAISYALKRRSLIIRHIHPERIVAMIEILSPGNKLNRLAVRAFLDKAEAVLAQGIHLLLIDLHLQTPHDPHGMHRAIWERLTGNSEKLPADNPLTLAAYVAGPIKTAYVERVAVGDQLPEMPLFLDPELYVNVPLEPTYRSAYEGVPRFYRNILEAP